MPRYEHHCNDCDLDWLEDYKITDDPPDTCPECEGTDVYRCVTTSGAVHFKGGGWSPDNYYNYQAYDAHKAQGKSVKLYDRKEDIERDMRGEAALREKAKLKRINEAAKRHLGPDAAVTEKEADKKIKDAVDKVKA